MKIQKTATCGNSGITLSSLFRTVRAGACAVLFLAQLAAAQSPRSARGVVASGEPSVGAPVTPRAEHLSLDANWKFHLGDDWPNASDLSHLGTSTGPITERFNDSAWRPVNLPHDWGIELPFDRNGDKDHSYRPLGRNFPSNSIAWYRRAFELPPSAILSNGSSIAQSCGRLTARQFASLKRSDAAPEPVPEFTQVSASGQSSPR
ncbi:MAG TPA: hypothetical protein VF430_06320 [Verrucomicrobiae bacterium]